MKNVSVKLITSAAVLGLAGAVYSFTSDSNPDKPVSKKYEVIRMVNGEMTQFDTIVTDATNYSPDDYLNDLGFGSDENVRIIDLMHFEPIQFEQKHRIHTDGNVDAEDERVIMIEVEEGEEIESTIREPKEIRIEKRVVKTIDGEGNEDVNIDVDVNTMIEEINIDSLIQAAMEMHGEGDSNHVFIHKVIVSDEEFEGEGENHMEWHSVDADGATYHKEINGPDHHMEVAVWGDEGEDFTMVIVTDPNTDPNKAATVKGKSKSTDFKLFPNPANATSKLQFNYEDKAPTNVTVTDIKGRVVAELQLGEFSGQFNHEFNVEKWSKGVYIVQVQHGNDKIIEKLIVE